MSGWNRRQLGLYYVFIAAVVIGAVTLDLAIDRGDRSIAGAIVAAALAFAVAWGVVLVIRVLRDR